MLNGPLDKSDSVFRALKPHLDCAQEDDKGRHKRNATREISITACTLPKYFKPKHVIFNCSNIFLFNFLTFSFKSAQTHKYFNNKLRTVKLFFVFYTVLMSCFVEVQFK